MIQWILNWLRKKTQPPPPKEDVITTSSWVEAKYFCKHCHNIITENMVYRNEMCPHCYKISSIMMDHYRRPVKTTVTYKNGIEISSEQEILNT